MSLGLSRKLNVLSRSPLDEVPRSSESATAEEPGPTRWVPSRFNIRAKTDDGSLVLWNSFHCKLSAFGPDQRQEVEGLLSQRGVTAPSEGLVGYLVERGFLISEDADEMRRLRLAFGRDHYRNDLLQLILLASEDCNFRCTYCYEDFQRGTMEPWVRQGIKKLVETRAPSLNRLEIRWFGGEPLYGMEAIEDLSPFFVEAAERHDLPLVGTMTTNGYLLTPEVARRLISWEVRGFQITLDGPAEIHDQSRPGRDGSGTFDVIVGNLRGMKTLTEDFLIDLRVNFDRNNHPRVPELLDLLAEDFGNDPRFRLHFHAVGKLGGANDEALEVCGTGESLEVILALKEEARRRGIQTGNGIVGIRGPGAHVCYAARPYNFIVGADGTLMKCTVDLDKKDRNKVGRITPEGKLQLRPDHFARWTEPAFEEDEKCKKCVVLPTCQGMHCPQIRFDHDISPCTPLRQTAKQNLRRVWEERNGTSHTVSVET